jgi:hypothetical protein
MNGLKNFLRLRSETDIEKRLPKALDLLFPAAYLDAPHDDDTSKTNRQMIAEVIFVDVEWSDGKLKFRFRHFDFV